ncbi:TraB family protein [uncultured Desulfobacterium sp.]|uniref:TraB family protein n=1 Tax=uncultured Desulfobacterium sp. TaxID=201089 RepID=A0A445MUH5_9BACT|nr:TraB family protein [uncultured Desulfobacterium sp.]
MTDNTNIHRLTLDDREITLIGTAHLSRESVNLVKDVIEEEHPDTVCIELCDSRYQSITNKNKWQEMDLIKVIREKKAFVLLSNLLLAHFQRKIGENLGIRPGEEMLQAIQSADSVNASVHLADRDIRTTLSRTWRLMGFWSKVKLSAQLLASIGEAGDIKEEDIEQMKKNDILENLLSEIGEKLPEIRTVLIDERDQYLAHKIQTAPGKKIVAVVGAGHVPGIKNYWHRPVDVADLEKIPPKSMLSGMLKWIIPSAIIAFLIAGFFLSGPKVSLDMVKWWVLATAIFGGIGAAIVLAHPFTVISAILASPITTLHPLIAAGWVSGIVEAYLRRPKVRDFEELPTDITTLRGFLKNKITRILLIIAFTNLGSSLGVFVAIPLMVRSFT